MSTACTEHYSQGPRLFFLGGGRGGGGAGVRVGMGFGLHIESFSLTATVLRGFLRFL